MREQRGKEGFGVRRSDYTALELETDWNYLRANLDHPAHRMGSRLGSGLAEWLFRRLHSTTAPAPQLSILARIALGPRQSLALVEAEGVHLLVGTSADGPPSFFSLRGSGGGYAERAVDSAVDSVVDSVVDSNVDRVWRPGLEPGTGPSDGAASAAGRKPARPRLTGRVSWV